MKKLFMLLLASLLIFSLSACTEGVVEPEPDIEIFIVETAFEYNYEKDGHFRHVVMPKVADPVPEGNLINEKLAGYNTLEELQESETWANWSPEDSFRRYYNVSNKDGICSLNIIYESPIKNGNPAKPEDYSPTWVESFYYDENIKKVLTKEEYLQKIGITEEQILDKFDQEYGDQYSNRTYDINHIIFWYDDNNKLRFSTWQIDQMDSNIADFHLIINGENYKTGTIAPKQSPFGETTIREETYADEVWAGSWWLEEYYDGAYVLSSMRKETGETYPFRVEITKANEDANFTMSTYRGAKVGDSRDRILELYPEINWEEQKQLNGPEDLFRLSGNGFLYLEFHFEKDIATKIVAGTIID